MKILVIYATAGAGHRKAAEAVYAGLQKESGHEAQLVDVLDYSSPLFRHLYSRTYTFLISKVPWLWAFFFLVLDWPLLQPLVRVLRRLQNSLNTCPLHKFLIENNFDAIVSTHFLPNEVAGYLKRCGKITSRIIGVVTDFDVHRIWLSPGVDLYTLASNWTARAISALGIAETQVAVTGIPTHEKFSSHTDIPTLKKMLGVAEGVFTVLMATGSFGIGPIEEILDRLTDTPEEPIQVLVVCGHNQKLFQKLKPREKDLVKIYGLVNNMDELMAVADAMVTKPGGLSISEALVSGLPMIFFNAIPGQETNNIRVLKEHCIGYQGRTIEDIAGAVRTFQSSPEEFLAAQQRVRALARPHAVRDIVELMHQ